MLHGCCGSLSDLEELDPHVAGLIAEFVHDLSGSAALSAQQRALCSISALTALDEMDLLEAHLREATASGVGAREMLEAVLITVMYRGVPVVQRAAGRFAAVLGSVGGGEQRDAYPPGGQVDGYDAQALAVGIEMYGPERARMNINNFRGWDRALADAVEKFGYSGVFRRRVLSPSVRETCGVAALAVLDKPVQLQWHAKAALRLGATPSELRWAAISQIPHVGFPPIVQAMRSLDGVITDWLAHP